ncbi:MAG: PH domain-containing protein [Caldilineaceae bacterium]
MLSGLFGNASATSAEDLANEFRPILTDGEQIDQAFRLVRDLYVFTNKRLILVDKQGLTGSKVEYHSIPYKSITHFSVETAGHFDLDSELKIWLSGRHEPFEKSLEKGAISSKFSAPWRAMFCANGKFVGEWVDS